MQIKYDGLKIEVQFTCWPLTSFTFANEYQWCQDYSYEKATTSCSKNYPILYVTIYSKYCKYKEFNNNNMKDFLKHIYVKYNCMLDKLIYLCLYLLWCIFSVVGIFSVSMRTCKFCILASLCMRSRCTFCKHSAFLPTTLFPAHFHLRNTPFVKAGGHSISISLII